MNEKILLGELREFKRQTIKELQELKRDVRSLNRFHWKLIGASGAASFFATLLIEVIKK